MKTIIAGGRNERITSDYWLPLRSMGITEVVSGCARGIDTDGEEWARKHGIPVRQFPADWERLGKAAGFIRNRQMAQYADAVVLFPGGTGTANMLKEAVAAGIKIYDWRSGAVNWKPAPQQGELEL